MSTNKTRWSALLPWPLLAALVLALALPGRAGAQRTFKQKDCLECHTKFSQKYDGAKVLHAAVKQRKCEDCHLRHGIVPALVLKKQGNALCYQCHERKAIGQKLLNDRLTGAIRSWADKLRKSQKVTIYLTHIGS